MRQQDVLWGEPMSDEEWDDLMREYGRGRDDLKSLLVGLGIAATGWGFVALCWWLA